MSKQAVKAGRAIAIFGGTFDPIHRGHLIVAHASARRFKLDAIYFVPSSCPPHKRRQELAAFSHRYAMVALACVGRRNFIPSLAEAPRSGEQPKQAFYSIDTIRVFQNQYPRDTIYFIVGADSFLEIPIWKSYEALLNSCDFIIANRPRVHLEALRRVIPERLLSERHPAASDSIALKKTTVHLLPNVASAASSTEVRKRCSRRTPIDALVPPRVEEYILMQGLYR